MTDYWCLYVDVALETTIAGMTVYADNKDDPYITIPDEVMLIHICEMKVMNVWIFCSQRKDLMTNTEN